MSNTTYDTVAERRAAVRVPIAEGTGWFSRIMCWYSRRTYGDVLDNGLAMMHNRKVLFGIVGFERKVAKWNALDADLKVLAQAASAAVIGCSWCLDFGYFAAQSEGLDTSRLREVPRWRTSDAFSDLERGVMEYAEAMSAMPPEVTDGLTEALRAELGEAAFIELTMMIAVENQRSRFNSALGLTSQGFSDRCELVAVP